MTPAIEYCQAQHITIHIHQYVHDPRHPSYGLEAVEKLALPAELVFKTLVVTDAKALYVAILPVSNTLNLKKMAKAVGVKKLTLADKQVVENKTGYQLGGVSPLAQKRALPTWINASAQAHERLFVSAGQRGVEIEIATQDLATLTNAKFAMIVDD